jgi:hypothetical protein
MDFVGKAVTPLTPENGSFSLERQKTYLFPVRERLNLRKEEFRFWGQATAKSSVGRVDVLARLIVDGESSYEGFTPEAARRGTGEMHVEITPITFDVRVKPDIALTQLRIFKGQLPNSIDCSKMSCAAPHRSRHSGDPSSNGSRNYRACFRFEVSRSFPLSYCPLDRNTRTRSCLAQSPSKCGESSRSDGLAAEPSYTRPA